MPVLADNVVRALAVLAASSSALVVRIPSAFSLFAAKAGRPSISEIGYVMILSVKCEASGELAEARRPRDDLAHLIRSDFVSAEPKKFTGDRLNVRHAKAEAHQARADGHQSAAHQPRQSAAAPGGLDGCICTGDVVDQGLHAVGRTFAAEETQNNADGLFSDSTIYAGVCRQPPDQLVHMAAPQPVHMPE